MYNLKTITPVLTHLQEISPNMYRDIGGELMLHCPYCNDAQRPNASNHGHLYVATESPVFNCFRCDTSGTMIRLLVETGYTDEEVLEYIASFIKYRFIKNYSKMSLLKSEDINKLYQENIRRTIDFKKKHADKVPIFLKYVKDRIGHIDHNLFFIYPDMINIKGSNLFCCSFNNSNNQFITSRVINATGNIRYKNNPESSLYYFQERDFEKYKRIVITEGPFDIVTLYLYSNLFKDCLFISISGKKFLSELEKLITQFILIGNYEVNLVFDNDYKRPEVTLIQAIFMSQKFNTDIEIRGYLPERNIKDVGDFPQVMEITNE
ncbi:MAG: hypothetical protein R3250_03470 [Melioribacteraceae bacterium]|nr:hypothetical protein [Melioribacteraceae bacterium]